MEKQTPGVSVLSFILYISQSKLVGIVTVSEALGKIHWHNLQQMKNPVVEFCKVVA